MNYDLELARAVFPDQEWSLYEGHVYTEATFCFDGMFCPLGDHFADVLAWLVKQGCVSLHGHCVVGRELHVDFPGPDDEPMIIRLDGTADSIKEAVYEAAIRVIKEEK